MHVFVRVFASFIRHLCSNTADIYAEIKCNAYARSLELVVYSRNGTANPPKYKRDNHQTTGTCPGKQHGPAPQLPQIKNSAATTQNAVAMCIY